MSIITENTSEYIIQTVAPIFNKKGYVGTSLSDLTEATGLTKGAIYGNFKNKEALAVKVFKYNTKLILFPLSTAIRQAENTKDKLFAITQYYRTYFDTYRDHGGCPILNVGIDANNTNPTLFKLAKEVSKRIEQDLESIIKNGITHKELKSNIDTKKMAKNIYSMIDGCIFMAFTHDEKSYITDMIELLEHTIYPAMIK
jgi:TetR/AcrR family transcriptional regulator, transcriptional repressor for nem operon